jgi:hypothetical protein
MNETTSNIEEKEDGLYEKSTGRKIESPLDGGKIFSLHMKSKGDSCFTPAGSFLRTDEATAADYLFFISSVIDFIVKHGQKGLEKQANLSGRTLDHAFSGVGSLRKVVNEIGDIDPLSVTD